LSSTYNLTNKKSEPKSNNTLFIGGVIYDYNPSNTNIKRSTDTQLTTLSNVNGTRGMGETWNYLPGTLSEVNSIENLFLESNKSYVTLSGKTATETSFKNLSTKSPNVLHIATHGFFFENPKINTTNQTMSSTSKTIYKASEDPLMRSGLVFAGANYAWQNAGNPYEEDDGVLTALEISNLDLSNTDMVVLSACETGLGDIDDSEGVYGLQRAFKMAGVSIIVMSLWEVPDNETADFMQLFYNNWLEGQPVRDAFRDTQLTMSSKYKNNPEKWAAFVLFE